MLVVHNSVEDALSKAQVLVLHSLAMDFTYCQQKSRLVNITSLRDSHPNQTAPGRIANKANKNSYVILICQADWYDPFGL